MLNFRHLYYFWMVSKEGGFAKAAERLDMAAQTISAQVRELERSLGRQLLKPAGRGVVLTEAGQVVLAHAEGIFQMGQNLLDAIDDSASRHAVRLVIGLSDGISKLAAHALLGPVLDTPNLRLICHEGEFEQLQAELALHNLDMVLTGQPSPANPNLRLTSDRLASSPVDWYGPSRLVDAQPPGSFPRSLSTLPLLLPTGHSALRAALDHWFHVHGLKQRIVGEFEDSALMMVFAAHGLGVFPVSRLGAGNLRLTPGVKRLGPCEGVCEDIYAIRKRSGRDHPLVEKIMAARR